MDFLNNIVSDLQKHAADVGNSALSQLESHVGAIAGKQMGNLTELEIKAGLRGAPEPIRAPSAPMAAIQNAAQSVATNPGKSAAVVIGGIVAAYLLFGRGK